MVWLGEGRGQSGAETEVACDVGHDRQDHHRVEVRNLAAMLDIGVEAVLVHVGDTECVGEEAAVETGILEHTGDVFITRRREHVVQIRRGVSPPAGMSGGGASLEIGEGGKAAIYLPVAVHVDAPRGPCEELQSLYRLVFASYTNGSKV